MCICIDIHSPFIGFDGQILLENLNPDYFCRLYAIKDLQNTLSEPIAQQVDWFLHGDLSLTPEENNRYGI